MASSQHPDGQATASAKDVTGDNATPDNVTDIAQARRRANKTATSTGSGGTSSGSKSVGGKSATKPATKKTSNRRFDHAKVASIKEAIANGTYTINAQRIADKFIEKESP